VKSKKELTWLFSHVTFGLEMKTLTVSKISLEAREWREAERERLSLRW
jgi:hypothetical protein